MSDTVFFNIWRSSSKQQQELLLEAMRTEAPNLQIKPGFVELTAWQGEAEDLRVVVEGRWESAAAFDAAITNSSAATESRERLTQLGTPEAGLFREAFRYMPLEPVIENFAEALPPGVGAHDINVNGQRIHYLRAGSGPLILLVHGYPESSRTWLKVIPALAEHFTVIAPDTRGVGDSSLAHDFTIMDVADDLFELVKELGFGELVLVGQDFGVQIVSAYAVKHREDVRALVVMESPLSGFGLEDLFSSFWHFGFFCSRFAEMLIQGREDEFFRTFAFGDFVFQKNAFTDTDIAAYVRNQSRPGRLTAGFSYYKALASAPEFFESAAATPWKFPVLTMDGDHSMAGLTSKSFKRLQPELTSVLLPDCGHFLQEEQPQFVVEALLAFAATPPKI